MENKILNREVTILFSENEFETLNFFAKKLNVSVPEVVRILVPRLPLQHSLEDSQVRTTADSPLLRKANRILEKYDVNRLKEICDELIKNRKAKTLADEIMAQLIEEDYQRETLNITTEKRLLRWAHPARVDERTRFVKPRAREICLILFGFIPDRTD